MRGGNTSMDTTRWQDIASLLSLPPNSTDPSSTPSPSSSSSHPHHPHAGGHATAHHHTSHHQSSPMGHHATSPPHTPSTIPQIHHPHAVYPSADAGVAAAAAAAAAGSSGLPRGVLLHNATLPPPLPDPMAHNLTYSNSMGKSHQVSLMMKPSVGNN